MYSIVKSSALLKQVLFLTVTLFPSIMFAQQAKEQDFVSLFNGKDLTGWVGNKDSYKAKDGLLVIDPQEGEGGGNLYTEGEYSNFILRFEFQLTPDANNGLGIHAPLTGNVAYEGKELQIIDNSQTKYGKLKAWQYHGSVYGVIAAETGASETCR